MSKYINVDEYKEHLNMICRSGYTQQVIDIFIEWFLSIADSIATEYDAPVVHSYWIEDGDDYICANCNEIVFPCVSGLQMDKSLKEGKTYWNYCPHCGAKMDEEEGQR